MPDRSGTPAAKDGSDIKVKFVIVFPNNVTIGEGIIWENEFLDMLC